MTTLRDNSGPKASIGLQRPRSTTSFLDDIGDECAVNSDSDSASGDEIADEIAGVGDSEKSSLNPSLTVTTGGYEVHEFLGKGTYGEVYRGVHQVTRNEVALKFLGKKRMLSAKDAQHVFNEIHCLESLAHTNVIRLLAVKNTKLHVMLVFEYAGGGDLKEYLESRKLSAQGPLTEREACDIFGKIVNAVSYCHKKNIVHRDLKLANILIQEQPKPQRRSRSSSSSGSTGSSSSSSSSSSGSTSTSSSSSSSSSSVADDAAHRSRSAGDHLNGANVAAGIKVADFGLSSIYSPGRKPLPRGQLGLHGTRSPDGQRVPGTPVRRLVSWYHSVRAAMRTAAIFGQVVR